MIIMKHYEYLVMKRVNSGVFLADYFGGSYQGPFWLIFKIDAQKNLVYYGRACLAINTSDYSLNIRIKT